MLLQLPTPNPAELMPHIHCFQVQVLVPVEGLTVWGGRGALGGLELRGLGPVSVARVFSKYGLFSELNVL